MNSGRAQRLGRALREAENGGGVSDVQVQYCSNGLLVLAVRSGH